MTGTTSAIVVGVDFSDYGRKAFDAAMRLAEDMDVTLVVVHVYPEMKIPSPMLGDLEKEVLDEARAEISKEEAMTLAEEWVAVARERGLDVATEASDGKPDEKILEAAKKHHAGLVVVGTHGRTGLKHLLLGSVAEGVVRHSEVPVLVVP